METYSQNFDMLYSEIIMDCGRGLEYSRLVY